MNRRQILILLCFGRGSFLVFFLPALIRGTPRATLRLGLGPSIFSRGGLVLSFEFCAVHGRAKHGVGLVIAPQILLDDHLAVFELIVRLAVLLELLVVGTFGVYRQNFELYLTIVLRPQGFLLRLIRPSLQT